MNRSLVLCCILYICLSAEGLSDRRAVRPLADEYRVLARSPDPLSVYCYTPGLARCPDGRLVATMEFGGKGVSSLPAPKVGTGRGILFTSDDRGKRWVYRTHFPIGHARPFWAGDRLYVLGHAGDLRIMMSQDRGESWSNPVFITKGQSWHQSACNVHYAKGYIYLVMERRIHHDVKCWGVSELAPVLMRGKIEDDLTLAENWTFASELAFCDAISDKDMDWLGVPFFPAFYPECISPSLGRGCAPIGWLETNVVQFLDPDHIWYDEKAATFHLWMRAHTGTTNLAAIAQATENEDGTMTTSLVKAPSGKHMVFVPCPGGQMRFHILYDERTGLYWLLSSQSTDSMCKPEQLPWNRYNLPNNERHRLQLHFSSNCVDWCFAGLVAMGKTPSQARHYASMVIDGDDLHVLSRSGDERAKSAHDGNMITFHTVKNFRRLVY